MSSEGESLVCANTFVDPSPQAEPPCGAVALAQERAAALAEVARDHHAALVRLLARRTRSAEEAKDILQEAYARVLALDRPDTVSSLVGYLWRTAANLAIDRRRKRLTGSRFDDFARGPASRSAPSTELVIELRERLAIVERAVEELPSRCRQAFLLRVVEGRRIAQVGEEMGITERMAKFHVARAMKHLQHSLDSADEPREPA